MRDIGCIISSLRDLMSLVFMLSCPVECLDCRERMVLLVGIRRVGHCLVVNTIGVFHLLLELSWLFFLLFQ